MSISAPDHPDAAAQALREQQMKQAEELLFSEPSRAGFAKGLFQGKFLGGAVFPYPELSAAAEKTANEAAAAVKVFADSDIDAVAIDREADIPAHVVEGLAKLGVLGMTAPPEVGGRGFSQQQYCRVMEVIGGHCSSTAVFVNAHHSIGIRALILYGTAEQKAKWLPPLARGETLAAFALTEEQAGSDASNVQTQAVPSEDGRHYRLNGSKRYITNGGIAGVLTVMARTPNPKGGDSQVTAFLVTPDMPGFQVVEPRMEKCGIRGTATAKLAFHNMAVPTENILGPLGKGLKVALTVLNFGRTTFGASCTGAMKTSLRAAVVHALRRRQFGRALADLELVKKKIAYLAAHAYAMEATTVQTAALIDRGADDYMLETAILKVYTTEVLWQGVYDVLQIHGGQGYFTNEPFERMMRDARINTIGEGANEVLKPFIALVGMRDVGEGLKQTLEGLKSPTRLLPTLWRAGSDHVNPFLGIPQVPVASDQLLTTAKHLGRRVRTFGWAVERLLIRQREAILEAEYLQERIADAAIALYTSACTLARLDRDLVAGRISRADRTAGELYLSMAGRQFDQAMRDLHDNDDLATTAAADAALAAIGK